jgi:hypothetical protein
MDLLPPDFDHTTALLDPGGVLDKRYGAASPAARAGGQRYFLYDAPFVDYIVSNTRRPLFRDVLKGVKNQIHSGCGSVVLVYEAADAVTALDGVAG